jgi:hypothetical protein
MFDLLQVEYKDIFLKKSKIYLNLNPYACKIIIYNKYSLNKNIIIEH